MEHHSTRARTWVFGAALLLAAAALAQEPPRTAPQAPPGQAAGQPPAAATPSQAQRGQPAPAPPPGLVPQGLSRSDLLATVELERLLDLVTASSGKQFLLDPRVTSRILVRGDRVPTELSYPTLLSILHNNGYAAVEIEGFVNIIPTANVRQYPIPIVRGEERNRPANEYVTTIIETQNVEAAVLVPLLRALIAVEGHLAATSSNQLIIVDRYANVRRIAAIIEEIDRPAAPDR